MNVTKMVRWLAWILATALVAFLALPFTALALRLASEFVRPSTGTWQALSTSAWTSTVAMAIVIACGTPLAWALARGRVPARRLVEMVLDLPMVLPPVVAGLGLLLAFGGGGPFGRLVETLGWNVPFTSAAVVMAQVFVSAPYYVRTVATGFSTVPVGLVDAARTLGASDTSVARRIVVPWIARHAVEGLALAWARALGEFGATVVVAGSLAGVTRTLPLEVVAALERDLDGAIVASAVLAIAAFALLAVVRSRGWDVRR